MHSKHSRRHSLIQIVATKSIHENDKMATPQRQTGWPALALINIYEIPLLVLIKINHELIVIFGKFF